MKANTSRRCVHLDFHMSPEIAGIGKHFSKENFQKALKTANLQSITVFAKCHSGYCYYPTKVGTMSPNLDFDLTGAWIEAAHEIGVKAPVYITAGWCALDAEQHPDWCAVLSDEAVAKLQEYVANGGKVVAFGESIVKGGKFVLDVGAEYVSPATHDMDYLMMEEGVETVADLPHAPMLCQLPAAILKEGDGD